MPGKELKRGERPLEGELLGPETRREREARERLNFLAWLLDSSIPIPGTRFTIGLDAVIGVVPFLGDLIGVALSSFIVAEASRMGAPSALLTRMAFDVAAAQPPFRGGARARAGRLCRPMLRPGLLPAQGLT